MEILPKLSKKIIFDEQQRNIMPLLNLGEEVKK
jgi:membrane protease subunit HflK